MGGGTGGQVGEEVRGTGGAVGGETGGWVVWGGGTACIISITSSFHV